MVPMPPWMMAAWHSGKSQSWLAEGMTNSREWLGRSGEVDLRRAGVGHPQKIAQAGEHPAGLTTNHPPLRRCLVSLGKAMRLTRDRRGPICLY